LLSTNGGTSNRYIRNYGLPTTATVKVLSVYAKANLSNFIQLLLSGDGQSYVNFDVSNGLVGTSGTKTTGEIQSVGNGWYRCIAYFDSTNVFGASSFVALTISNSVGYSGYATSEDLNVYIWGSQYEEQSYATSYIPTNGSQTTRNQELSSKNNVNELFDGNVGSIYLAYDGISSNGTTLNNMTPFRLYGQYDNKIRLYYAPDADFLGTSINFENGGKIAWSCNGTTILTYVNGVLIDTHTITNNFTTLSNFALSTNFMTHRIADIKIYPKALLDAELIKLTT
jgi:hypothetical protein